MTDIAIAEYKQLYIDDASKANLVKIRIQVFYRDVDALAERMYAGQISLGQWEEDMRTLVRELHTGCTAIGKGGWDLMTPKGWGQAGAAIKKQYRWLHGFAEDIEERKDTISLAAIKARAHLYGEAGGYSANLAQAGDIASMLPWIPRDGQSECMNNCKCAWILVEGEPEAGMKTITATWTLSPAEHCDTCLERSGHVETLVVPAGTEVPDFIGGL